MPNLCKDPKRPSLGSTPSCVSLSLALHSPARLLPRQDQWCALWLYTPARNITYINFSFGNSFPEKIYFSSTKIYCLEVISRKLHDTYLLATQRITWKTCLVIMSGVSERGWREGVGHQRHAKYSKKRPPELCSPTHKGGIGIRGQKKVTWELQLAPRQGLPMKIDEDQKGLHTRGIHKQAKSLWSSGFSWSNFQQILPEFPLIQERKRHININNFVRWLLGWGGGFYRPGGQGSNVYVLCAEPKEHNHFVRVPGRVTGVTEKLFTCQMFMCLFWPLSSVVQKAQFRKDPSG